MRLEVFLDDQFQPFAIVASIELASFDWGFFILEVAKQKGQKLMTVMLHDWMEPLRHNFLQMLNLNDGELGFKDVLIEGVEPITIRELVL